jgi:hypothetical protein
VNPGHEGINYVVYGTFLSSDTSISDDIIPTAKSGILSTLIIRPYLENESVVGYAISE